jgi:hypothetical protein
MECKQCGTPLSEENTYKSDWARHVRICKSCKAKTFATLRQKPGYDAAPARDASAASVTTRDDSPVTNPNPPTGKHKLSAMEELELIRQTPTWRRLLQEGRLERDLNAPIDPDEEE